MTNIIKTYSFFLTIILIVTMSCNNSPKVLKGSESSTSNKPSTGIFDDNSSGSKSSTSTSNSSNTDMHTVTVKEVLPTSKYVYLRVTEKGEEFWIAALNQEVKIGEQYSYQGGLLKTNFESKEYNRVFDKVFLVSRIIPVNQKSKGMDVKVDMSKVHKKSTIKSTKVEVKGSTKIADIIKNPKKYAGKTIQVSGVCTKLNSNIMGRNWIHLKDGSKDDYDFVVTSKTPVLEGSTVTLKAMVTIDKDFGAGYRYDIIMEDGVIVK